MTKNELFEFFLSKPNPDKNGKMKREKIFMKNFPVLYNEFIVFDFDDDLINTSFAQRLWHFLQNDHGQLGHCKECGKRSTFTSFTSGYSNFCSTKCSNKNKEVQQKQKNTLTKKYGGVGFSSKQIQKKSKQTMIERYGNAYSSNCESIKKKIFKSTIEHFGGVGFASKQIQQKFNKTMFDKYGVNWAAQSKEIIEAKRLKKISSTDEIVNITDDTYTIKCNNQTCDFCKEKCFTICRKTYATRKIRNTELCTKINPPIMCEKGYSSIEKNLYEYISNIYNGIIEQHNRILLNDKEIDIYLPELKLGFEFNGDYWHMNPLFHASNEEQFENKTCSQIWNNMMLKEYEANQKEITLLQIWENDWKNNKDYVCNKIKQSMSNGFCPSAYFKIKNFLNQLNTPYTENVFGEFVFENITIKYINAFYYNKNTIFEHLPNDYGVVYVYDFEINDNRKFEILKSQIKHALHLTETRIFARKCTLKEIDNKIAKPFLEDNSLFGHRNAKLTLGLYHGNELLMVYSFGHNFYGKKNYVEVIRVCTKKNTVVIGGSTKCLSYFLNHYSDWLIDNKLIFYVDRIHNNGHSLSNFKFIKHEYGYMNYWYYDYFDENFIGYAGTAFNRMPSKHHQIKNLCKQNIIAPVETLGVDVYEYEFISSR